MFGSRDPEACRHRFEPRYSIRAPEWLTKAIEKGTLTKANNIAYESIYECDVCPKCGKVVTP